MDLLQRERPEENPFGGKGGTRYARRKIINDRAGRTGPYEAITGEKGGDPDRSSRSKPRETSIRTVSGENLLCRG